MSDTTPHPDPEDRFLVWVDGLVDPATAIPVPDPDLADVAGTAAFVQRAAGIGGAPSLSPDRTEALWEEIMHTTAPTVTPTLPAGNGARPIAPRPIATDPAPGWRSYAMIAALIATIVVAGIATAWRIAGPFDLGLGGKGPEMAHQPGIAGSATPATSADGCPLTNDMLVFVGETSEGVDDLGVTYALVENGNLTIQCPGVESPEPLMTGVTNAMPLQWPGTVLLELEDGNALAYNIASGERIGFGDLASVSASTNTPPGSPWLLTPVGPDVHLTNLRTMRSTSLAVIAGGKLPDGYAPVVVSSPDTPYAVITAGSGWFGYAPGADDPDATSLAEMPGTALVIDESLERRRWIDVQGQVTVGDGVIAYETQADDLPVLRVEDAATGEAVFESGILDNTSTPGQRLVLAGDGETIVYIRDWRLWFASYRDLSASTPPIGLVDTDSRQPIAIHVTGVPGHVLVEWNNPENIGGPGVAGVKTVSILDTATGEVTDVKGLLPIDPDVPGQFANARYLVTIDSPSDLDARTVARMTDIATGEAVLTSEPIDATVRELIEANYVFGSSTSGAVATVNPPDGAPILLSAVTGTMTPVSMDSLPTSSDLDWRVTPSSDGALLFAIGRPQSGRTNGVDITSPNALPGMFAVAPASSDPEWSDVVDAMPAGVIPGITAEDASDEPAVLEAQEFATPAPVATASPVAETGCDLDADIPVVTGLDAGALDRQGTTLVLSDGTLSLTCDAVTSVVAEGVTEVIPGTTWPGAVLLHMGDGSLRGVNLRTGAEGDFGDYHDSVLQQMAFTRVARWMLVPPRRNRSTGTLSTWR